MRIILQARCSMPHCRTSNIPLFVTIKPIHNGLGSFEYQTDTNALLRLLHKTDLASYMLDQFRTDLTTSKSGRLPSVDLKDEVLQEIGYFID